MLEIGRGGHFRAPRAAGRAGGSGMSGWGFGCAASGRYRRFRPRPIRDLVGCLTHDGVAPRPRVLSEDACDDEKHGRRRQNHGAHLEPDDPSASVTIASLAVGVIVFGWHPLVAGDGSASTALQQANAVFGQGSALAHLGIATAYVAGGMVSIFAFAFFLSTLTSRPLVAVAGGVGLTILSRLLNGDYLSGVAVLNPYMPNNDVDLWQHLLQQPAQTAGMTHFLLVQLGYAVVFLGLAWWWFSRKDVLA